jgi:putative transposase
LAFCWLVLHTRFGRTQTTEVIEWLKNKEYWNLDELVTYLEQELGVIYKSKQSYYELFDRAKTS